MAQYTSSSTTPSGIVINAVLDTVSNTITYTATAPNGVSATNTQSSSLPPNQSSNISALTGPLNNAGVNIGSPSAFKNALTSATEVAQEQANRAAAAATATDTPVPSAPSPAPPVPSADNPNPVPPTPAEQNAEVANPLQEPPGTADEFDGIDQQVADNENSLQEPPQLSDEEVDAYLQQGGEDGPPVTEPETTTGYQEDPTTQTFDDGSSIQTFDDGSTLVTDADGNVTSTESDPGATGSSRGLGGQTNETRSTATAQDTANFETKQDWRVRLTLAPSATYLYKAENPGILKPLKDTDGVIFPYLPTVNVSYIANYDPQELTHSNYKAYQYRSSSVEQVQISGDFTAQDTAEANYMLAVIHFFRSVTKMFYGQDQNPKPGTPPPLVFLFGLGDFQFNAHPLVVTNFNYSLPNDVDYIRASAPTLGAGVSTAGYTTASNSTSPSNTRMSSSGLNAGATAASPQFQTDSNSQPTYVPTKMQIQITALPMVTRNDISNNFSLKQYATGALLRGSQNKRAGIW